MVLRFGKEKGSTQGVSSYLTIEILASQPEGLGFAKTQRIHGKERRKLNMKI